MALIWADGFDAYAATNIGARYASVSGSQTLSGPGRIGYGQYITCNGGGPFAPLPSSYSTLTTGAALYITSSTIPSPASGNYGMVFVDASSNILCTIQISALGAINFSVGNATTPAFASANGLVFAQAWCYIEAQITFSSSGTGSLTIRLNGQTVITQSAVTTSVNANPCASVQLCGAFGYGLSWDDWYILNSTAPNNSFFGDVKILPLYPVGNGRISGFSRQGGTSAGNYTAVQEHPPDGDSSYVYTATAGTSDAYTITTLSNVTTVKAVQVSAYARKDDTPSRVLALGVGNGTTENYDAGHSLNTTYTYVERQMDTNPLTSAAWAVGDFTTLQLAQELIS